MGQDLPSRLKTETPALPLLVLSHIANQCWQTQLHTPAREQEHAVIKHFRRQQITERNSVLSIDQRESIAYIAYKRPQKTRVIISMYLRPKLAAILSHLFCAQTLLLPF